MASDEHYWHLSEEDLSLKCIVRPDLLELGISHKNNNTLSDNIAEISYNYRRRGIPLKIT